MKKIGVEQSAGRAAIAGILAEIAAYALASRRAGHRTVIRRTSPSTHDGAM
jgi:hypothetical protein